MKLMVRGLICLVKIILKYIMFCADAELTFSVSVKLLEAMHVEVLVPNGDEMAVTEENKALYAATLRSWLSHDRSTQTI